MIMKQNKHTKKEPDKQIKKGFYCKILKTVHKKGVLLVPAAWRTLIKG